MNIFSALGFPFRGPHAWPNIGCILVCFLIPIIGPMVIVGFMVQVQKRLIDNIHADAPAFSFGKFSIYLQRGVPPFLASLLLCLGLLVLLIPLGVALVLAIILLQDHALWMALAIAAIAAAYVALTAAFGLVANPLVFKAGVEGSFHAAFDGPYLLDYLRRVFWPAVGIQFFMFVLMIPLFFIMCIPIVGPYAAMSFVLPLSTHLTTQLYLMYLQRGGAPLAIQPEPPDFSAFPVEPRLPPPAPVNRP